MKTTGKYRKVEYIANRKTEMVLKNKGKCRGMYAKGLKIFNLTRGAGLVNKGLVGLAHGNAHIGWNKIQRF